MNSWTTTDADDQIDGKAIRRRREREREGDVLIYFRIKENRTVRCVRVLHFTVSAVIEECTKG